MKTVCQINECTACAACKNSCPVNAIKICDSLQNYNAYINQDLCINCGLCMKVCQKVKKPNLIEPIIWRQGWNNNADARALAASGGMISAIATAFKKYEGFVYLCKFIDGEFIFCEMKNTNVMKEFAGSKYVKSDCSNVYKEIELLLKKNNKVLFVGLPCQVAGLRLYLGNELEKKLYTIDLICHGTPSVKLLEEYLIENKIVLSEAKSITFRKNTDYNLYIDNKKIDCRAQRDTYSNLFLNGKIYTDNCYKCDFATIKRVSDITVGDSWGSMLDKKQVLNGISLVLCQTGKGKKLLDMANISLYDVDLEHAILCNHQLEKPMKMPKRRTLFFKLNKKMKFDMASILCFPISCIKQYIRGLLHHMGIG